MDLMLCDEAAGVQGLNDSTPVSAEYYLDGIDDRHLDGEGGGEAPGMILDLFKHDAPLDLVDVSVGDGDRIGDDDIPDTHEFKVAICCHPLYPTLVEEHLNIRILCETPDRRACLIAEKNETVRKLTDSIEMSALRESRNTTLKNEDLDPFFNLYIQDLQGLRAEVKMMHDEVDAECDKIEKDLEEVRAGFWKGEDLKPPPTPSLPRGDDQALRSHLKRRYGDAIVNLRNEFARKQKKGKLPKESTSLLKKWWRKNFRWPYPSDEDKKGLGEATSLTPTQINNWFINQRKRHWHKLFPKGIPASAEEAKEHFVEVGYPVPSDDSDSDRDE